MKTVCLALAFTSIVLPLSAAATPQADRLALMQMMATSFAQGACHIVLQQRTGSDGTVVSDYAASNADLHYCQYVKEQVTTACMKNHSCMSYDRWSRMNAALAPQLPRSTFLEMLAARQTDTEPPKKESRCALK